MKKLKFITLSIIAILSFSQLHSQCASILFEDDFEGSTSIDPAWSLNGSYTRNIATFGSPQGTNHLEQFGNSPHYNGMIGYFTTSTPTYASWWVRSPSSPGNCGYVVMGDANTNSNNGIIFEYFTSAGTLRFYNNTVNYEMPVTADTWYHVEMVNINFASKNYDLYVNGVLVQGGYAFRSLGSSDASQIHLYNYDASTYGVYDNIVVQIGTDTTDPVITAPANVMAYTDPGQCDNSTLSLGSPIASDFCGIASITNDAPSSFPLGTTNVTWTATDSSGNSSTAIQTVTVTDTIVPNLAAPIDTIFDVNNIGCTGMVILSAPAYSDNCMVSISNDAPSAFPLGTTVVTWTATDLSGNTSIQTQNVTITNGINTLGIYNNITCFGANDGTIDISPTGGAGSYTFDWNSGAFTSEDLLNLFAGNYTGIITDSIGCTDTVNFTITEPSQIDVTVNITGLVLTAQQTSATYQWIDCNNGDSIIIGETNQSFNVTTNGSYAVIVTVGGCSDTSMCNTITSFGVEDYNDHFVEIYPNPSSSIVNVRTSATVTDAVLKITDLAGKVVWMKTHLNGNAFTVDISDYATGIYLLQLQQANKTSTIKLIKN